MGSTRRRWSSVWQAIKANFTEPEFQKKYVGSDYLGNRYYECEHSRHYRRFTRHFEHPNITPDTDPFDILSRPVPPAWDAWLRFGRRDPPSEEEVQDHEDYFRIQQQRAKEAAEREVNKSEKDTGPPRSKGGFPKLPIDQH